jgi:hypothetical protein
VASDVARELFDAADLILRSLEEMEDDAAQGKRVNRTTLGDVGYGLGSVESCVSRLNTHLNGVVLRLGDKDAR